MASLAALPEDLIEYTRSWSRIKAELVTLGLSIETLLAMPYPRDPTDLREPSSLGDPIPATLLLAAALAEAEDTENVSPTTASRATDSLVDLAELPSYSELYLRRRESLRRHIPTQFRLPTDPDPTVWLMSFVRRWVCERYPARASPNLHILQHEFATVCRSEGVLPLDDGEVVMILVDMQHRVCDCFDRFWVRVAPALVGQLTTLVSQLEPRVALGQMFNMESDDPGFAGPPCLFDILDERREFQDACREYRTKSLHLRTSVADVVETYGNRKNLSPQDSAYETLSSQLVHLRDVCQSAMDALFVCHERRTRALSALASSFDRGRGARPVLSYKAEEIFSMFRVWESTRADLLDLDT